MANKDVSVKQATDKELDELIFRLRKERECLDLISSIRDRTMDYNQFEFTQKPSTEEPINNLYHDADTTLQHFGVKGMKWEVVKPKRDEETERRVKAMLNGKDPNKKTEVTNMMSKKSSSVNDPNKKTEVTNMMSKKSSSVNDPNKKTEVTNMMSKKSSSVNDPNKKTEVTNMMSKKSSSVNDPNKKTEVTNMMSKNKATLDKMNKSLDAILKDNNAKQDQYKKEYEAKIKEIYKNKVPPKTTITNIKDFFNNIFK